MNKISLESNLIGWRTYTLILQSLMRKSKDHARLYRLLEYYNGDPRLMTIRDCDIRRRHRWCTNKEAELERKDEQLLAREREVHRREMELFRQEQQLQRRERQFVRRATGGEE